MQTKFKGFVFIIASICVLLLAMSGCSRQAASSKPQPKAVNGTIDLTAYDFAQDGILFLDGEWEFHWEELLQLSDLQDVQSLETQYIRVPGSWNKYDWNNKELSSNGYATYVLNLKLPHDIDSLALKLPRMFTAYTLWLDGDLLTSSGRVADNKEMSVPQYYPKVITLNPDNSDAKIIIQVSNFFHRSGGMLESIKLGTETQIFKIRENHIALEFIQFGCLFIMGIYHIFLYLFRRKNQQPLYFGLYCILIAIRTLFVGEIFIIQLFPNLNWEIQHKIQTLTFYIGVPVFTQFIMSVFPEDLPKKALLFTKITGFCFSLVVLLMPVRIFTIINPGYQLFTAIVVIFVLYTLVIACVRRRKGAPLVAFGCVVFIATTLNDILFLSVPFNDYNMTFFRSIITSGNLSSFGLIVLVFTQSIVLAINFSKTFTTVEVMSEKLIVADLQKDELLYSLESKVQERTAELKQSNTDLETALKNLSKAENSRKQLLTNISHDIKTPMTLIQGYSEAILDGIVTDEKELLKYITLIQNRISGLSQLTNDLFELSQLESRSKTLNAHQIPLANLLSKIDNKFRYDVENADLIFKVTSAQNHDILLSVDIFQIERVFSNLVYNAIGHTKKGSITIHWFKTELHIIFEVTDTGSGIDPENLPFLFDRLYTGTKPRNSSIKGSGLGLAIAKEIIEYHGGEISAESVPNQGSTFRFSLSL